jgi:hypothetical protein
MFAFSINAIRNGRFWSDVVVDFLRKNGRMEQLRSSHGGSYRERTQRLDKKHRGSLLL